MDSTDPTDSTEGLWTENPALAELYDTECAGRWDHDFYLALAEDVDAQCVLDVGCGTGVFSVDVANAGRRSIGIDPASAMLDIARARPGGHQVEWILGTADDAETESADLVVMMGHVAQYFLDDAVWLATLKQIHRALKPGGRVTFEVRNPAIDWPGRWTKDNSIGVLDHPRGGSFTSWVEVVGRSGTDRSYSMTHEGNTVLDDGSHLRALETLRFRSLDEVRTSLLQAGFDIENEWGDWKRAPLSDARSEFIFLARRA